MILMTHFNSSQGTNKMVICYNMNCLGSCFPQTKRERQRPILILNFDFLDLVQFKQHIINYFQATALETTIRIFNEPFFMARFYSVHLSHLLSPSYPYVYAMY